MTFRLSSDTASIGVDPDAGGRLASFEVAGHELLVARTDDPLGWGCYPMVPFAGRVRRGQLVFDGQTVSLPLVLGEHAIHGFGFTSSWERCGENEIRYDFSDPWPYRGSATQSFTVHDDQLSISMRVDAIDRQPVAVGWHPWFRRDAGNGSPLELTFEADTMFERDDEGLPSGRKITPSPGPWDDCFTDVRVGPTLRWDDLVLELTSSVDHWVVYDETEHAVCVEPQSGPPNDVNDSPRILESAESSTIDFTIAWSSQVRSDSCSSSSAIRP